MVSNRLEPGQAYIMSGLIMIQSVCKAYQQATKDYFLLTADIFKNFFQEYIPSVSISGQTLCRA